jgi:hypothetical protein
MTIESIEQPPKHDFPIVDNREFASNLIAPIFESAKHEGPISMTSTQ